MVRNFVLVIDSLIDFKHLFGKNLKAKVSF